MRNAAAAAADDDDDAIDRVRVERHDDETLSMYIDNVIGRDEGQYSCESDFDGQLATQYYQLTIHGQQRLSRVIPNLTQLVLTS